jgi:hypothetical protein
MATTAQINANRANAQKSTGPKTPEGKAASCLNHVSHGFTGSILMVKDLEERKEFDALLADLTREFQPATPHEQILVEKMVFNQWNSLRAIRLQSIHLTVSVPRGYISKDLGLLIRYQTAADRAYHKAHAELLKAQEERRKSGIGFDSQPAGEVAGTGSEVVEETPLESRIIPDFRPIECIINEELAQELDLEIENLKQAA